MNVKIIIKSFRKIFGKKEKIELVSCFTFFNCIVINRNTAWTMSKYQSRFSFFLLYFILIFWVLTFRFWGFLYLHCHTEFIAQICYEAIDLSKVVSFLHLREIQLFMDSKDSCTIHEVANFLKNCHRLENILHWCKYIYPTYIHTCIYTSYIHTYIHTMMVFLLLFSDSILIYL